MVQVQGRPTHDIEHETNEAMVSRKRQENLVDEDDVLEVVDDTFAVEKIHGSTQEVPVECLGEAQLAGTARNVGNGNDLLEGDDLNSSDNHDDVDVTGKHGSEEEGNHDNAPYCSCDERLLLLLVL